MEQKEVKIQIPDGYEIDSEKSTLERIVFKKKCLTYEAVMAALLSHKTGYFTDCQGTIFAGKYLPENTAEPNAATNREQLEQILALNKLMNVAKYLNGGWKPDWSDLTPKYCIYFNTKERRCEVVSAYIACGPYAYFATEDLAYQAIEILGEDTVKAACGIFE